MKKEPEMPNGSDAYLKANLRRAQKALRAVSKEERDISAVTVSLSRQAAEMVAWELDDLRKRILELAKADAGHAAVYQCNLQFFPLSK
jgi:uncharacterized protein (TIGR02147 family)